MVLFKKFLALSTGCLSLAMSEAVRSRTLQTTSAAPTSFCDVRPIDYFYFQMDVLYENDSQAYAEFLANNGEIGAPFIPVLDAANVLRAGAQATMDAITGCVSPYPKTEPPTASKATKTSKGKATKSSKEPKDAKSSKMPKEAKAAKSSKGPKNRVLKEAKSSKTPKDSKEAKTKSSKSPKEAKSSKAPKSSEAEAEAEPEPEVDVLAEILQAIYLFDDNSYFMNSYNTVGGTAWTFGYDDRFGYLFEAIPVRDVTLAPGAFTPIVCGYKSLVDNLVLTHESLTGTNTARDYAAAFEADSVEYYGTSIIDYC